MPSGSIVLPSSIDRHFNSTNCGYRAPLKIRLLLIWVPNFTHSGLKILSQNLIEIATVLHFILDLTGHSD